MGRRRAGWGGKTTHRNQRPAVTFLRVLLCHVNVVIVSLISHSVLHKDAVVQVGTEPEKACAAMAGGQFQCLPPVPSLGLHLDRATCPGGRNERRGSLEARAGTYRPKSNTRNDLFSAILELGMRFLAASFAVYHPTPQLCPVTVSPGYDTTNGPTHPLCDVRLCCCYQEGMEEAKNRLDRVQRAEVASCPTTHNQKPKTACLVQIGRNQIPLNISETLFGAIFTRCVVLAEAVLLCCYRWPFAILARCPVLIHGYRLCSGSMILCTRYAMSGTEIGYATTRRRRERRRRVRSTGYYRPTRPLCHVRYCGSVWCY
eukprot:3247958-Rhodomonas_salina.2